MRRCTASVLIAVAALTLAAGCGTASGGTPGTPTAPVVSAPETREPIQVNVADALSVAQQEFSLIASGDWSGAWQLWTEEAKKSVPEEVFVTTNEACPVQDGVEFELQEVNPVSETAVDLTWRRDDTVGNSSMRLEQDTWRFDPGGGVLVEYASGADDAIANRQAAGSCPS
ncbi:hypothetical protein O7623_08030 [Solwaraspora sp. WMMD791]|uniref:hypothetical protein n=1 Tax=Solwaraspora sp. WMMD791 TaxID=3016086 RepID=UPI00249A2FB2|nr:hypothetical protein [Solwaraspora sp. WMMD791]WFE29122.1 hypothetical protein O7623_08030 [Solwaraspora sp. WMMD791]